MQSGRVPAAVVVRGASNGGAAVGSWQTEVGPNDSNLRRWCVRSSGSRSDEDDLLWSHLLST